MIINIFVCLFAYYHLIVNTSENLYTIKWWTLKYHSHMWQLTIPNKNLKPFDKSKIKLMASHICIAGSFLKILYLVFQQYFHPSVPITHSKMDVNTSNVLPLFDVRILYWMESLTVNLSIGQTVSSVVYLGYIIEFIEV